MTSLRARAPVVPRGLLRPASRRRSVPSLLSMGDLLLDVVVTPRAPLETGSDVPGTVAFRQGGSAANVARAFAGLGGRAALVASVGEDRWGRLLAASLRANGVRLHLVPAAAPTGRLAALVTPDAERSFVTQREAADELSPGRLQPAWFRGVDVLHVPAYSLFSEPLGSAAARAARLAKESSALVSSDLSSRGPLLAFGVDETRARLVSLGVDILFANRAEASALLGRAPGRRPLALARLLEISPLAVVKEGAAGCRVLWRHARSGAVVDLEVAAARVTATDTTGAGDAFAAGFLHALLSQGRDWRAASLRRAAVAGHRAAAAHLRAPPPEIDLR
jgi:sugar/nucleoside kinase (ribokinase family)